MFEQELWMTLVVLFVGFVSGVIVTLLTNKIRSGSASPTKIKQEMEEYQDKVEAHFEETSERFKKMSTQYQELYQHLSVGATSLCRPENIAPGLVGASNPLDQSAALEQQPQKTKSSPEPKANQSATDKKPVKNNSGSTKAPPEPITNKSKTNESAVSSVAKDKSDKKA